MIARKSRPILKVAIFLLGVLLLIVVGYLLYVILTYDRIEDNLPLIIDGEVDEDEVTIGTEYTIVTQNIGFGAYTRDFTFFMDGGKQSRARSKESMIECIDAAISEVSGYDPDFILFQEVDLDSTRSLHTDQYEMLLGGFDGYSSCKAINYDSAYLMYPFLEPHGASYSSIATFSRFTIQSSLRRSLPISTSFSKFLDLDRCYSVSRVKVDNGKELVIYNVHSSAYGGSDEIRTAQMTMLMNDMKSEYDKGNYVVCGGDFNHDFTSDSTQKLNGGMGTADYGWAQPFPADLIPEGLSRAINYKNGELKPTCRDCDIPYVEGNFTASDSWERP